MSRLPSLFVSHGAPTFALSPGQAGPQLTELGRSLPRPAAVLVVSPHWMPPTPRVSTSAQPTTIHDFGGFDSRLYQLNYPASGHPVLARRAIEALAPLAQEGVFIVGSGSLTHNLHEFFDGKGHDQAYVAANQSKLEPESSYN